MQTSGNSGLWKSTTRLVRSELLHFLSTAPLLPLTKVSPTVSQNHSMKKRSWNILGAIPPFCRAVSADPSLGARAAGCPLLHQGCSGDALLPFWDKTQQLWPKSTNWKVLPSHRKNKLLHYWSRLCCGCVQDWDWFYSLVQATFLHKTERTPNLRAWLLQRMKNGPKCHGEQTQVNVQSLFFKISYCFILLKK